MRRSKRRQRRLWILRRCFWCRCRRWAGSGLTLTALPPASSATNVAAATPASALRGNARTNANAASGAQVDSTHGAILRFRIDDVVVGRIGLRIEPIAAARAIPVGVSNARSAARLTRPSPRTVVLQTAIDVIRLAHVSRDGIELRRRNRADEFPRRALIVTNIEAAIVADQNVIAVLGIDPNCVMIAVRNSGLQRREFLSAIS